MMFLMFSILLFSHILTGVTNTNAAPLSTSIVNIATPECLCSDKRTIWNIIWSCLATIFACSWVSVHPNIPGPDDSWIKKVYCRLELMFWSIIVPELITYWAAKQWSAARKLEKKYHSELHVEQHVLLILIFRVWMDKDAWLFHSNGGVHVI
jgi:hypothetical protein